MSPLTQKPRVFLARLALAYVLAAGAGHLLSTPILARMQPLIARGLHLASLEPTRVALTGRHAEVSVRVAWADPGTGARVEKIATVGAPRELLLVGPIILLTIVLAFRSRSWRGKALSLGFAFLFAPTMMMFDMPMAFAAAVAEHVPAEVSRGSPVKTFWWFFLDNGGRQILAVATAASCLWLGAFFDDKLFGSRLRPYAEPILGDM